jgi:hypothetical protein
MSNLAWGKPRIFVKDLDVETPSWKELNTPVQDSTELQPTKGDKMEAPIEGGENEEVKFKDSTYAVVYNIRKYKGRQVPIANKNGVASHHYAFCLMPEDGTNIGFYIESTTVSVDDTFTANDGAIWAIQHDALAAKSGNTVKWGTVGVAEGKLSFSETQPAEGAVAKNFSEDVTVLPAA